VNEREEMFLSKAARLGHVEHGSDSVPGFRKNGKRKSTTNLKLLSLLGSSPIVASTATAAVASEHHSRHHKTYASETVRNVYGSYDPSAVSPENQSAFGPGFAWKSGMQPDDWRQSVNGN
jgi:hypothetical protein